MTSKSWCLDLIRQFVIPGDGELQSVSNKWWKKREEFLNEFYTQSQN